MKKWFLHILLVGMLGMHTTSCVTDDDLLADCPEVARKVGVQLQFTLDMGDSRATSRADVWNDIIGDNTDDDDIRIIGTDYENMIDLNTMQVFLFDASSQYKGEVNGLTLNPSASSATSYTFTGKVVVDNASVTDNELKNYTIMVVANNVNRIDGLVAVEQNQLFDYIADNYRPNAKGEATSYIPMWGMLKANIPLNEETAASYTLIEDPIFMLRSMAKIEVELSQDVIDKGYKIAGATTLNKYNQNGYLLPALGTVTNYFGYDTTSDFNTEDCFNPSSESLSNTATLFNVSAEGDSCVIYVPEYANDGSLAIQLDLEDSSGNKIASSLSSQGIIKVNEYQNGKPDENAPLDLIRNHWYCFTVGSINDGVGCEIKLEINPWNVDEENIQFTDEVSVSKIMQWKGTYITPNTTDGSILYINGSINESTAATVTFQIDTPIGATWYASFEGDKDAFAFLDDQGNEVTSVTGEVGTLATLKIVTTEEHVAEMKSVSLMIVVRTMDGRTIMVNKDLMPESLKTKDYYQIRQNLSI